MAARLHQNEILLALALLAPPPHCLVAIGPEGPVGKDWRMHSLRYGVVLVTFMACVAISAVWLSRNGRDGVQELGTSAPELAISDEQREHIFDIVMGISDVPVATGPTLDITDALPDEVPMQDLPTDVSQDIPLVQGHKFVKFDDRILIVQPSSRLVVAMIPRYKLVE